MTGDPSARLFFALWPAPRVARELALHAKALRVETGGRALRQESIHLTLAFLGQVSASRFDPLLSPPASVTATPFAMDIDRLGVWSHNGIGWAGPSEAPAPLTALQLMLGRWLRALGFVLDARPFTPHVTLVRNASGHWPQARIPPVAWDVTEFVLVRSDRMELGAHYTVVASFPLRAQ